MERAKWEAMSGTEQALSLPCPRSGCGAKPGQPCRYTVTAATRHINKGNRDLMTRAQRELYDRIGTPAKKP